MDRKKFINLMESPNMLGAEHISSIHEVINQFPYFQTSRFMMLKSLYSVNNIRYNKELKITAAYASDRKKLYEFIYQEEIRQAELSIDLSDENLSVQDASIINSMTLLTEAEKEEIVQILPFIPEKNLEEETEEAQNISEAATLVLLEHKESSPSKIEDGEKRIKSPIEILEERLMQIAGKSEKSSELPKNETIENIETQISADPNIEDIVSTSEIKEIAELPNMPIEFESEIEKEFIPDLVLNIINSEVENTKIEEEAKENENIAEIRDSKLETEISKLKSEIHSFSDWLKISKSLQITDKKAEKSLSDHKQGKKSHFTPQGKAEKPIADSIIDKFIKESPRIVPARIEFYSPINMARQSVQMPNDIASETLAGIYLKQGDIQRARKMYEILMLNYPEKSTYFASLIEKINSNHKL